LFRTDLRCYFSANFSTTWWIAAARQGDWRALDNLATDGVGRESDIVREAWKQLEKERRASAIQYP